MFTDHSSGIPSSYALPGRITLAYFTRQFFSRRISYSFFSSLIFSFAWVVLFQDFGVPTLRLVLVVFLSAFPLATCISRMNFGLPGSGTHVPVASWHRLLMVIVLLIGRWC